MSPQCIIGGIAAGVLGLLMVAFRQARSKDGQVTVHSQISIAAKVAAFELS